MENFKTRGTCSRQIVFDVDENEVITYLHFVNGCGGNLQGLSRLLVGQKIDDVVSKLKGIKCQNNTSCPDQLCEALLQYKARKQNGSL